MFVDIDGDFVGYVFDVFYDWFCGFVREWDSHDVLCLCFDYVECVVVGFQCYVVGEVQWVLVLQFGCFVFEVHALDFWFCWVVVVGYL